MEKLQRIQEFFKYDLEVKKMLHDLVPNDLDAYNNDSVIKYSDKLYDDLKVIKYYITRITSSFCPGNIKFVDEVFKNYENNLASAGFDFNKLKSFYKNNISDMSVEFVNKLNKECVGYTFFSGDIMNETKTINEMLHFLHHYIMNNEKFYEAVPKIEEKNVCSGYEVTLRGMESEVARNIYNMIPDSLPLGVTDIISLPGQNKVLMMVRDVGHALTIEVSLEENGAMINYFIPKVCNYDMVNSLKGVKKVSEGDKFTVGCFESTIDRLPFEVVDFISRVPTDDHMFIEGGLCYNPEYSRTI